MVIKVRNIRADDKEDTSQLHKLTDSQIHKTKQYECQGGSKRRLKETLNFSPPKPFLMETASNRRHDRSF